MKLEKAWKKSRVTKDLETAPPEVFNLFIKEIKEKCKVEAYVFACVGE